MSQSVAVVGIRWCFQRGYESFKTLVTTGCACKSHVKLQITTTTTTFGGNDEKNCRKSEHE